jgi:hypothetical protein
MAERLQSKRLSVDTNVLLDMAAGYGFAVEFRTTLQRKGYSLHCVPGVLAELNALTKDDDKTMRERATTALENLILWDISPVHLTDVEKKYRENFMNFVAERGVLPAGEVNDARILADTAISNIPLLVTSDAGILDADEKELDRAFDDAGLIRVKVARPKGLLKVFSRPGRR